MYLPPLEPVANNEISVLGDVKIHPSAVLAPGTIIQAAPDCQINIGADVCIGMGTIVSAERGSIEIESGAILGAGVLIVGNCKIGRNACIGSATTIFNASVEMMTVVSSGSLIGDTSRQLIDTVDASVEETSELQNLKQSEETSEISSTSSEAESFAATVDEADSFWFEPESVPLEPTEEVPQPETKADNNGFVSQSPENLGSNGTGAGQIYINQLLVTLFPHRQALNRRPQKNSEED